MGSCAITLSLPFELVQNFTVEARQKGYLSVPSLLAHEYLGAPRGRHGPSSTTLLAEKNLRAAEYARLLCKRKRTAEETATLPALREKLRALADAEFSAAFDEKGALLDSAAPVLTAPKEPAWKRYTFAKLKKMEDWELDGLGMSDEQIAGVRKGVRP